MACVCVCVCVCVCMCVCVSFSVYTQTLTHTHILPALFPRVYILGRIFLADADVTCWVDLYPG